MPSELPKHCMCFLSRTHIHTLKTLVNKYKHIFASLMLVGV